MTKEPPMAKPEDALGSTKSDHVTVRRKRGRPRKAEKEELLAEKKIEERTAKLTKSRAVKKKQKAGPKKLEFIESDEPRSPTFERFQELPTDVRLKIWNFALPGPRLVEMCSDPHPRINSHRSTPSILHVCSESRKEALKSYTAFPLGLAPNCFRVVYVNFQIDTLYFSVEGNGWMPKRQRAGYGPKIEQLMNNVRFVAIKHEPSEATSRTGGGSMPFLQRFGKLEELTMVVSDVGLGEITDEFELDIWHEWQIGDFTGEREWSMWDELVTTDEREWSMWDEVAVEFAVDMFQRRETDKRLLELKRAVVARDCLGLKNIQARIVKVERGVKLSKEAEKAFRMKRTGPGLAGRNLRTLQRHAFGEAERTSSGSLPWNVCFDAETGCTFALVRHPFP